MIIETDELLSWLGGEIKTHYLNAHNLLKSGIAGVVGGSTIVVVVVVDDWNILNRFFLLPSTKVIFSSEENSGWVAPF